MPRPAKHDASRILEAAAGIVASKGPAAATMTAIGIALGAPSGSIYHRFRTRDELMGRLWLSKAAFFQGRAQQALDAEPDGYEAGLAVALSIVRTVREDPHGARIMLLHRREDFLSEGWPAEMKHEAERLGEQIRSVLRTITRRLYGSDTKSGRRLVTFAVVDAPYAAVRRFIAAGESLPQDVDALIAKVYAAVISRQ